MITNSPKAKLSKVVEKAVRRLPANGWRDIFVRHDMSIIAYRIGRFVIQLKRAVANENLPKRCQSISPAE